MPRSVLLSLALGLPLLVSAGAAAQAVPPTGAQVTIPLADYEQLARQGRRPSITVVDTLRLRGSFRGRNLAVELTGRAAGDLPRQGVLSGAAGVRIFGCDGPAIVSRGDGGSFELTPLAERFTVRCSIATSGSDRLELQATPAVLSVESAVEDGEFVGTDDASGGHAFSVVRVVTTTRPAEVLAPSVTGRYRLSLYPEETRVRYQFDVRNPNRAHQPFAVTLGAAAHVQQVDAQASYEVDGDRYRFDLPPGESTIVLTGTYQGERFAPPVDASVQYLVIESHPLLRVMVDPQATRVSPTECGVTTAFRGAQAFLLDRRQSVGWQARRLEVLRSMSFAARSISHTFFVSAEGGVLGESALNLDNQGSPDVALPMRAQPTFASLGGEPTVLTKNAEGNLWLPLSHGPQQVLVQHRQKLRRTFGFAAGSVWLPQLSTPATSATVELRYPEEWRPLYEELPPQSRLWDGVFDDLLWWLVILVWTERLLCAMGLSRVRRFALGAVLGLCATASGVVMALVVLANLVLTVLWVVPKFRIRWTAAKVIVVLAVAGLAGVVLLGGLVLSMGGARMAEYAAPPTVSVDGERSVGLAPRAPSAQAATQGWNERGEGQAYQGLPAKFDLPAGARRTFFSREMLSTARPLAVRVLLVSSETVFWLAAAVGLVTLGLLLVSRRELIAGWKNLLARARSPQTADSPT